MIDFKYRTLTAKIIDNGQHPESSAVVETVRNKIHGPVLIDPLRPVHHHPEVANTLLTFLQAQREPFFSVETLRAFVVDQMAFPAQKGVQLWGTELTSLFCKLSQA